MELKLNIYKSQNEIKKTYTADTYDVMMGTVEDLLNALDLDALMGHKGATTAAAAAGKLVANGMDMVKPLLKDIFPDLTDEELRHTKAKEVLSVIVGLTGFSLDEIKALHAAGKKALEGQKMG